MPPKKQFKMPEIKHNSGLRTEYQNYFKELAKEIHVLEKETYLDSKFKTQLGKPLSEKERHNYLVKLDKYLEKAKKRLNDLDNSLMFTTEGHLEYDFLTNLVGTGYAIRSKLLGQIQIALPELKDQQRLEAESIRKGMLRLELIRNILLKYKLGKL